VVAGNVDAVTQPNSTEETEEADDTDTDTETAMQPVSNNSEAEKQPDSTEDSTDTETAKQPNSLKTSQDTNDAAEAAKDVFLYIIYEGNERHKIGLNSQTLDDFRDRYHTYYGEFKYLKFPLNHLGPQAKKIGHNIETQFKKKNEEYCAFNLCELYDKLDANNRPLLSTFKKSMMQLIANHNTVKSVRNYLHVSN